MTNLTDKKHCRFAVSISKEELNKLPAEKYTGEIITIEDEATADEAIKELERVPLIGFDTETRPSFQKGHMNQVALIQLATESKCFLFRICKTGITPSIKSFLEDENIKKVGLSLKDDFHNLSKIKNITPKGFIDLQNYVKDFKISDCSLTKIHGIIFGKKISKSQQLSNWEAANLTQKQKEYAALDARVCVNIYNHLIAGKFKPEDSPFYKEICEEEN